LHVHGVAEVRQNLARAALAGVLFLRVARFAPDQLLVFEGHGSTAHPILAVTHVYVIEFSHAAVLDMEMPRFRPQPSGCDAAQALLR
jgi:hypothetical protein